MEEVSRFEDFVGLINGVAKEVQRIKAAEAAKLGLKGADIMCLHYLLKHPEGLASADLAREAGVTRAAVSRTLSSLVDKGYVRFLADGEGAYRAPVVLTASGRERMEAAERTICAVVDEAGSCLDPDSRAQMYASLSHVLDRLRAISRA